MDGTNIQHYFEKLDRALKRLGIILVDDYEEVKKGVSAPIVALVRKLLFNTSTIVMKYMLLRGCASHVSDKKVVISLFDLLRETVKYSPPISIDQFFTAVRALTLILFSGLTSSLLTFLYNIPNKLLCTTHNFYILIRFFTRFFLLFFH